MGIEFDTLISDDDIAIVDASKDQEINDDQITDEYSNDESTEDQANARATSNDEDMSWFTGQYEIEQFSYPQINKTGPETPRPNRAFILREILDRHPGVQQPNISLDLIRNDTFNTIRPSASVHLRTTKMM